MLFVVWRMYWLMELWRCVCELRLYSGVCMVVEVCLVRMCVCYVWCMDVCIVCLVFEWLEN